MTIPSLRDYDKVQTRKMASRMKKRINAQKAKAEAPETGEPKTGSLSPVTKAFLEGVYDEDCVLHQLNGMWHILKVIWGHVRRYWKENLLETRSIREKNKFDEGDMVSYLNLNQPIDYKRFPFLRGCAFDYSRSPLRFPEPNNININMMPFIMEETFEACRLPNYLEEYWHSMISYCSFDKDEIGKVSYLTIHESEVGKACSQRRPGLHTERPGKLELRSGTSNDSENGKGASEVQSNCVYHPWGIGIGSYEKDSFKIKGGIFMASNVANSCRVWDCQVLDNDLIGHLGDIEHLRSLLLESENMLPNCMYWITDRTPHESLPVKERTYRQYFRLVTSQVSLWFEDHSTKNPLGVVPDPKVTKIVKGSKFKKGEAYIVPEVCEKEDTTSQ